MSGKGKVVAKSMADLANLSASTAPEVEFESNTSDEDFVFEGGELDGKRMTSNEISKEFRAKELEVPDPKEIKDGDKGDSKDAKASDQKTEVAEEGSQESETPSEVKEASTETTDDASESDDSNKTEEKTEPKYEPNFGYKVYDEQREFPDWAKPLVTSKETEENFRTTLQKSEAFDVLKPKHETVIRDRDQSKAMVNDHVAKVNRLIELRQKDPLAFFEEVGASDDLIISMASKLLKAQDSPELTAALDTQRETSRRLRARDLEDAAREATTSSDMAQVHQNLMRQTLEFPAVSSLMQRMNGANPGSFDVAMNLAAATIRQGGHQGYIQPADVAQKVLAQYGPLYAGSAVVTPVAPVVTTQTAPVTQTAQGGTVQPVVPKVRPKTLPNLGKGSSASPVGSKPKSLADVKKRTQSELRS
jgi:hypothetical protein